MDLESEQTTEQTFRVTSTPEGRLGVAVFVEGKPSLVLWLGSESHPAAERLALHLEPLDLSVCDELDRLHGIGADVQTD